MMRAMVGADGGEGFVLALGEDHRSSNGPLEGFSVSRGSH